MAKTFVKLAKSRGPVTVTPTGVAVFPKLNTPDTKFKEDGEYTVRLRLPDTEAKPIIEAFEKFLTEAHDAQCKADGTKHKLYAGRPFDTAKRKEDGVLVELDGLTDFNFKMKATTKRDGVKITVRPQIIDSKKNPCRELIWGGSELKIAYRFKSWMTPALGFGVGLQLAGVQVLKLVGPDGNVADMFGEEDGYSNAPAELAEEGGDATPAEAGDASDF